MFIGAESILGVLDMYRLIWISGRFGGHKTALAFKIAERYLERGYRCVTNSRCIWADPLHQVQLNENNQLHAVVILDEGGLYFKSGRQIEQIAAYAAKMDCVYIIPSFFAPTKTAQIVNIQPIISLKATGLPIIIYKWVVSIGGFKESGCFAWFNPAEIYGIYSRQDPGDDPDDIIAFLTERSEQYRKRYGRTTNNKLLTLEALTEADKILEASEIIAGSFDGLETLSTGKHIKRR